ncbi:hypothetical protein TWF106_003373 [Orbilia oligospora]|uniref:Uncharacterized protein n=1 Tax=Orbilia oligospora TaxID=2813651 RepID=A0A6G1MJM5_ORBOL|nr:hypothetical protein TWF788_001709 [Orbilia oligospora]KAF3197498.1 hypothetical protein TWF679_003124 [Orbilia oligospora]KAF3200430.1 hypothetical protein TWF106_003373 [Orbilia oligospora]KAF3205141.1 hypothetical protein TWF191_001964 [Orbilia oligospora]KAF3260395.1 hypothetical protein TWF192_009681 [Orbilia oligospora]
MNWVGGTRTRRRDGQPKPARQQKEYFARLRSDQWAKRTFRKRICRKLEHAHLPIVHCSSQPTNSPTSNISIQQSPLEPSPQMAQPKSQRRSAKRYNQTDIESRSKSFVRQYSSPTAELFAPTPEFPSRNPQRLFRKGEPGFGGLDSAVDIQTKETQDLGITDLCKEAGPTKTCNQGEKCDRRTENTAFAGREQERTSGRESTQQYRFISSHVESSNFAEYVSLRATLNLNWKAYILFPYRNPVDKSKVGARVKETQGAMLVL